MEKKHWVGFVSKRFIRRDRAKITLMVAVAISVATLIVVLSVMNGLQLITINNLIQIDSYHLSVQERLSLEERRAIRTALTADERLDTVISFTDLQTIAYKDQDELQGVNIRAVSKDDIIADKRFIEQLNVVHGAFDLSSDRVLIGTTLARALKSTVGDSFEIFGHNGQVQPVTISGIFQSGYPPFDSQWVIMNIDHAQRAINNAAQVYIGIKYRNERDDLALTPVVHERIASIIGRRPNTVSWRESNKAIFSAFKLEKIFIIFILGMIFIIVAINIQQSLARKVRQKNRELAILKAMGGEASSVQQIITYMGFYIGLVGSVFGTVIGLWISLNIENIFSITERAIQTAITMLNSVIIMLPNTNLTPLPYISSFFFFISAASQQPLIAECIAILLFAVLVSSGAAYISSRHVVIIRPIKALRTEGH